MGFPCKNCKGENTKIKARRKNKEGEVTRIQMYCRDCDSYFSTPADEYGDEYGEENEQTHCEQEFQKEQGYVQTDSPSIRTIEDALNYAEVDKNKWEVYKTRVNTWGDNYQIRVDLRLKSFNPASIIDDLTKDLKNEAPNFSTIKRQKNKDDHLLEIGLVDHHFGMLAWSGESNANYDLDIAENLYQQAITDMLDRVENFSIGQICIPIGHDFFHLNDQTETTPKSNNNLDVDGRLGKIFLTGCKSAIKAVELCRQVAPVEIIYVPGNHDPETSFYLVNYIDAWFNNADDVSVDIQSHSRKYRQYGLTALGFCHGEYRADRLPQIMATEIDSEIWANTIHRELHIGHEHKVKEVRYNAGNTYEGIRVRTLPSLCNADKWHYDMGFLQPYRAAECYLWHPQECYVGHFSVNYPNDY